MTSTIAPRPARPGAASALTSIGFAWSFVALAMASYLMWGYISEFNSCSDLAIGLATPVILGLVVSVPSLMMLLAADRLSADDGWRTPKFMMGALIASVVIIAGGILVPKPGPPCMVRRANLRGKLVNLATMQEAFAADSHRYSASLDTLGAKPDDFNAGSFRTVIAWADSSSWGAYVVFTDPQRGTRWMCAMVEPEDTPRAPAAEGVARLANGCWNLKRPDRIRSYSW